MTLALAVIGAATGLVALLAQVLQFTAARPRVKVAVANTLRTDDHRWWLSIDVINIGRLPVTINDVGLFVEPASHQAPPANSLLDRVRDGMRDNSGTGTIPIAAMESGFWSGPPIPHRLSVGESVTYLILPQPVAVTLIDEKARHDVKAYGQLATGKRFASRGRVDVLMLAEANARPAGKQVT